MRPLLHPLRAGPLSPPDASRRRLLIGAAFAGGLARASLAFAATGRPTDRRFVLVILRGGLDGLSAVPAPGDPDFAAARGALAQFASPALPLDGMFALHPALSQLHAMHARGEATIVHAVGLPYRERSHFDAQQVLESGGVRPYELTSGWLGRALRATGDRRGIALSTAVPLVLRGDADVDTWAPSALPDPSADLVARLERMYADDALLAPALQRAKALHLEGGLATADAAGATMTVGSSGVSMGDGAMAGAAPAGGGTSASGAAANGAAPRGFVVLAQRAAEFLSAPRGPDVAVLELGGWDTHANQANPNGPLVVALRQLDAGLGALRSGLGETWKRTVVVVATEFGREVAVNGTLGTDHGTGGAAFVLGGAIRGGRVLADWPGLAKKERFEGRDLRTTTDTRALLKGVLADHLQIARTSLDREVFPGSESLRPLSLLAN
jgi:uncharacterized protein (DUF1501 family)